MKAIDYPIVGSYLRTQKALRPWEPYGIWDSVYPGFSKPFRDLRADDVTDKVKSRMKKVTAQMITPKRNRLMIKITGWPRIGFFSEIFPDAKFIHIVRDGRAVVNSMLNVHWWTGWKGTSSWGWGELTPEEQTQLTTYGHSFVALASIEWNHLMQAMEVAKQAVDPANFLEIRYENFCADVVGITRTVAEFCELPWNDSIAAAMGAYQINEKNYKWQEELTATQQGVMNDIMAPYLKQHHYL